MPARRQEEVNRMQIDKSSFENNKVQKVSIKEGTSLDFRTNEAYKSLRTNIQFCGDDIKTIAVTSCMPNEGKSSVAFNLAISLAESGKKVILLDCDLRKSVLVGRYKISKGVKGMTHYLTGMHTIDQVICCLLYTSRCV